MCRILSVGQHLPKLLRNQVLPLLNDVLGFKSAKSRFCSRQLLYLKTDAHGKETHKRNGRELPDPHRPPPCLGSMEAQDLA